MVDIIILMRDSKKGALKIDMAFDEAMHRAMRVRPKTTDKKAKSKKKK